MGYRERTLSAACPRIPQERLAAVIEPVGMR